MFFSDSSSMINKRCIKNVAPSVVRKQLIRSSTHLGEELLYVVSENGYETSHEHFLPDANTWYEGCRFFPSDINSIPYMQEDEKLLWRCLNARGNAVLISGKAGSGKTNLLKRFIHHCVQKNFRYILMAPTGIAAFNVGGVTVHHALGLGTASESGPVLWEKLRQRRRTKSTSKDIDLTMKFLTQNDVYIFDEVSMLHPSLLKKIDYLLKRANRSPKPLGGKKCIFVGDFTQLGPVMTKEDIRKKIPSRLFETNTWKSFRIHRMVLERCYRQQDSKFLQVLNEVRVGKISSGTRELLRSRVIEECPIQPLGDISIKALHVFSYRKEVRKHNEKELQRLSQHTQKRYYAPIVHVSRPNQITEKCDETYVKKIMDDTKKRDRVLQSYFPVYHLELCVGAQVMMCCNRYRAYGVMNGSVGIVKCMNQYTITVDFISMDNRTTELQIGLNTFQFKCRPTVYIEMKQFPLCLAWASTIHKVQGLTVRKIFLKASDCFAPAQLYIGMSRVRQLEDLFLTDFDEHSLITDDVCVQYELSHEKNSK
jgi:hypothetical protein